MSDITNKIIGVITDDNKDEVKIAIIAATKQHHKRIADNLHGIEENEEGYKAHGKFLEMIQDHHAALMKLCEDNDIDFYGLRDDSN